MKEKSLRRKIVIKDSKKKKEKYEDVSFRKKEKKKKRERQIEPAVGLNEFDNSILTLQGILKSRNLTASPAILDLTNKISSSLL